MVKVTDGINAAPHHARLQFRGFGLSSTAVYVVQNCVFHKNADGSTYEGGKQADVDVVAGAVEASEGGRRKIKSSHFSLTSFPCTCRC